MVTDCTGRMSRKRVSVYSGQAAIDPYALAICGTVDWNQPIFPYKFDGNEDLGIDDRDSAPGMPKSVVVDSRFDWEQDRPPGISSATR
jgi:pullulanase/glycogen debranching enzyme